MNLLKFATSLSVFITFIGISGCSSSSHKAATETRGASSNGFALKEYKETKLSNGLTVILIEDKALPYFSLNLLVKSGSASDPEGRSGLAYFMGRLLSQGTTKYSTMELQEKLALIASSISVSVDADFMSVGASTIANHADDLLELYTGVLLEPKFAEKDIERIRGQILSSLHQRPDQPSEYANDLAEAYEFGSHPYAKLAQGTMSEVKGIQRKDIIQNYLKLVRPNNAILSVVGSFDSEAMLKKLESRFATWKPKDIGEAPRKPVVDEPRKQIRLVNKKDLVQAQIRLVHLGTPRSSPDHVALRVASYILGGGLASRLMEHVRAELGLTYSISASFDPKKDPGPFEIATFTKNETVAKTIKETLATVEKFVNFGVSDSEVQSAKSYLWGRFPQAIETSERLAYNLQVLRLYGVPDSYLTEFKDTIQNISVKDVNRVIKTYFHPEKLKILVYANKTQVLDQLKELGEVEVRESTDFL